MSGSGNGSPRGVRIRVEGSALSGRPERGLVHQSSRLANEIGCLRYSASRGTNAIQPVQEVPGEPNRVRLSGLVVAQPSRSISPAPSGPTLLGR
jgi:hypothetical protein